MINHLYALITHCKKSLHKFRHNMENMIRKKLDLQKTATSLKFLSGFTCTSQLSFIF